MTYLDNASTTKPCEEAIHAMTLMMTERFGNPSSLHRLGSVAEAELKNARNCIASALSCDPAEVFFTSGGTESDNWAVIGGAEAMRRKGRHIIVSAIEHHAVLEAAKELESRGFEVTYLRPDAHGRINAPELAVALRPDTVLVSVMLVGNETGAVNDIAALVKAVRESGCPALFHTDAVQGFLKIPVNFKRLDVDLLTISGHKIHACKGIGALVIKKGVKIKPLLFGGGQQSSMRPGTEPMPQIMSLCAACEAASVTLSQDTRRMAELRDYAISEIGSNIKDAEIIGAHDAPHIVCLAVRGARSQGLINCLQDRQVYVSAGSACSKGKRSHVLSAMGVDSALTDCSIRLSLSRFTERADIDRFIAALIEATGRLIRPVRELSASG